jgi:uncharacterized protein YdhG (YjbR/CyaY superfamily)
MTGVPEVEAYLAALPDRDRAALQALRDAIRAHLPLEAQECMSYAMPGFRLGKMVAGYAAFKIHLGFYPHSGGVIPRLAEELAGWKTSKSGVLFTSDHPLPTALIHRILDLRLAEIGHAP